MTPQGEHLRAQQLLVLLACIIAAYAQNNVNYYDSNALFGCNSEAIYFVSDYNGNQVRAFGAQSGTLIGSVLPTNTSNIGNSNFPNGTQGYNSQTAVAGPNGVVIYNNVMYLVNQNSQASINGSVLAFQVPASVQQGKLDASQLPFPRLLPDPIDSFAAYSPDAPRGIVIGGSPPALFVADAGPAGNTVGQVIVVKPTPPYDFIGTLSTTGIPHAFDFSDPNSGLGPQGLVIGPHDGLLYVTIISFGGYPTYDPTFGAILRFDISTLPGTFKDVFASTVGATDCSQFLHRPEGMAWGPAKGLYKANLLYVTGYTASAATKKLPAGVVNNVDVQLNDKILIYTPDGKCLDYFVTEPPNVLEEGLRTEAVAGIFGPKGKFYFPVSSLRTTANTYTGGYRAYSVPNFNLFEKATINNHTAQFETIVPPTTSGPLAAPFYSTFGRTDPGTLEYQCLL